ncbi:hypothetical protein AOQ84DRAFT_91604 [Glonium stellatum]|uniref:Nephrocystin 3-like N-terminal domain-containing protein n=1 Tax=Glonium stellatum TaxID=574774 RepID=A0A8E2EW98_9PEZI|nr:hypothetical protein AOQ84DRAFT_91604 [Glonium stellatum]
MRVTAKAKFQALREAEDLQRRSAVYDWLSAADTALDQEIKASVRAKYPGVYRWVLDHTSIQVWRDSASRPSPILWVNGIPKSGKTTLASFLIEHLREIPSAHIFFFYCKHKDKSRNSFIAFARAIISQAITQNDSLISYVYEEAATYEVWTKSISLLTGSTNVYQIKRR